MNHEHTRLPDLNLLRVFLAIWDLRSLTAAADRLGLTQPAVSHALRRLRVLFDDPLFVRVSNVMAPTEAANRLHGPLDEAFAIIGRTTQKHRTFDPANSERVFRIAMSDMSEFYVLPPLLLALAQTAPGVRLRTVRIAADLLSAAMRAGEIELALGYLPALTGKCRDERLFSDEFVCILRADHPLARSKLTKHQLMRLRYIDAGSDATGHQALAQWLADQGIEREVILQLSHFTAASEIVRTTDFAAVFPRRIAERYNRMQEFSLLSLPVALPAIDVNVYSHELYSGDAGISWLRDVLVAIFKEPTKKLRSRVAG